MTAEEWRPRRRRGGRQEDKGTEDASAERATPSTASIMQEEKHEHFIILRDANH